MIFTCPKCGGKRITTWVCHRERGCRMEPTGRGTELLREPPLPFDADYHAHRQCLDCGAEWASTDLGLDD